MITDQSSTSRPRLLGITMGDASGIGPEIIVRSLTCPRIYELCHPVVIGDAGVMQATSAELGAQVQVHAIARIQDAYFQFGIIDVLDLANVRFDRLKKAKLDAMAGHAAVESVLRAIELAQCQQIDGVVTAPLHKQAMHSAGYNYPGHTELFAEKTGTSKYAMMFVAGELRVVLMTIHCPLREVPGLITRASVLNKIQLAQQAMQRLSFQSPKIAVAGINPHAGEGGLFGLEEIEILAPAIDDARAEGIDASGPYPADTLFTRALKGEFDVVVAMYHDQGLIPVKSAGFEKGVNITLGLPFIRTSPDHGTAFDRAWKWQADPGSMTAAIEIAALLARSSKSKSDRSDSS